MTTIHFLADWAMRSSIVILSGAFLLLVLRARDVSVRLAAWTAMLFGSLLISRDDSDSAESACDGDSCDRSFNGAGR